MLDKPKLTLKQRKWIKEYLDCGNATEAAMRVYNVKNRDSANAIGAQNLEKINIEEILDEHGISNLQIAAALMEGAKATKIIMKGLEVPDYNVRHKYLTTILILKKHLFNNSKAVERNTEEPIRIVFSPPPLSSGNT